jgi:multisubunit Na+/H+ antiporter MnhG subunit
MKLEGWRKILFGTEGLVAGTFLAYGGRLDQIAAEFLLGTLAIVITGNVLATVFGNGKKNGNGTEVKQ